MKKQTFSKTNESGPASFAPKRNSPALERQHSFGPNVCVQREASGPAVHPSAPALVREVVGSPGQPLDSETRSDMEPRFGYDFSGVRVHTDESAAESARAVSAKAYTAGSHVVFGAGQHAPGSSTGQRLMAHELTHVVQQASGPVEGTKVAEGFSVSHPRDHFELEARRFSNSGAGSDDSGGKRSLTALPSKQPAASQVSIQRADSDLSSGASHAAFAGGLISAAAGVWSAVSAERQADIAKDALGVSKDALAVSKDQLAEAHQQNVIGDKALAASVRQADAAEAQQTTIEGINVTHAAVPDFHQDDKSTKRTERLIPIVKFGVGDTDLAQYRLRLQIDAKGQIRGGSTEEEDVDGYVGGFAGSNATVSFSAIQDSSGGGDSVIIRFKGTNVAGKRQGVQRIHGEVKISAPKWQRDTQQFVSHPDGSKTKQANGPWALIPEYTPPAPQNQPAPAPADTKKKGNTPAPKKGGGK